MFKIKTKDKIYNVNVTIFPDKTSQVWKLDPEILEEENVEIIWRFDHEGELFQLQQLRDLLYSYHVWPSLYIEYLPYARQDKRISNETTWALSSFAQLLN